MSRCPRCQSFNIVSNKLLSQSQIAHVAEGAQFLQRIGGRRFGIFAGLGALAMQGINALYRDCWCRDCHHLFDLEGDQSSMV